MISFLRFSLQARTLSSSLILILAVSMALPGLHIGINNAHGINQTSNPTNWLPFGPQSNNTVFQYYTDSPAMFSQFSSGSIDVTDWPVSPSDIGTLCTNPDFFCGSPQLQLGVFDLQINHHSPLLGIVPQLMPRTLSPVHASAGTSSAACSTGFGSVSVTLENQETGNSVVTDPFNNMTLVQVLSGNVLGARTTLPGWGGTGVYAFPCVVAGTYLVINSEYANCPFPLPNNCEVIVSSAQKSQVNFATNYNSPSPWMLQQRGIYFRMAIAHLLNKQQFITGPTVSSQALCVDIFGSRVQGFSNAFCSPGAGDPGLPSSVLQAECSAITSSEQAQGISGGSQISIGNGNCNHPNNPPHPEAYLLNNTSLAAISAGGNVWWGTDLYSDPGYASQTDIRAACDLLFFAGFPIEPSGATCIDVANASVGTSPVINYPNLAAQTGVLQNHGGQQLVM